jgi:hypothetical protein
VYDRLCGLVVRVSGYIFRGPGFDSLPYQIFREVEGLERGPLRLVRTIEELQGRSRVSVYHMKQKGVSRFSLRREREREREKWQSSERHYI